MIYEFRGSEQREAYDRAVEAEGFTVSPGTASALMGFSRQYLWKLMRTDTQGIVRAWAFYDSVVNEDLTLCDVSVADLVRYAIRNNRLGHLEAYADRNPRLAALVAELTGGTLTT